MARQLTNTTTTEYHRLFQSITVTASTAYTYTVYLKNKTAGWVQLSFYLGGALTAFANFNLSTGALGTVGNGTAIITPVGNNWYKCSLTATAQGSGGNLQVYVLEADSPDVNPTTTGTGKSVFIWGAQLEAGAFATSYIPTVATTITRAADQDTQAIQVNVYTGSIKLEFIPNHGVSSLGCPLWSSYIDASNYSAIFHDGTNMLFRKRIAGTNYDASIALTYVAAQLIKVAVSWSNVNINIAVNGLLGTANANTLPLQLSSIQRIGALEFLKQANNVDEVRVDGGVKNIAYYPIVLSTSNLVALTS
jgi:hypothetical protein